MSTEPPPYATDRVTLERESQVSFQRRGGPGGQHRNKVETAVRLFHPPSGVTILASAHRSQSMNREEAFERLAAQLKALNHVPRVRRKTRPTRGSQRRRLQTKRKRSETKKNRRKPTRD